MNPEACTARLATAADSGVHTAVVCASAVVHGNSGAESAESLSARFARPIQGARYLNRATRLAVLAVDRLGLAHTTSSSTEPEQLGVIAATFGAHFEHSRAQFSELLTKERPLVSPMLGPNSIPSSVSSCVSIHFNARAFTLTFCDSGIAGTEALAFAARAVSSGRARNVVVVGVESRPSDIECSLFGESAVTPPDEAYAFLIGDRAAQSSGGGPLLTVHTVARRFGAGQDDATRKLGLRRCLLEIAERARKLNIAVDVIVGNLRQSIGAEWEDTMSLPPSWKDAHWFDHVGCHPGLRCVAGLAHLTSLYTLTGSGQVPEGLCVLNRGGRALNRLRGAVVLNASADGAVACTLLRSENEAAR